jgi:hypothetical protein
MGSISEYKFLFLAVLLFIWREEDITSFHSMALEKEKNDMEQRKFNNLNHNSVGCQVLDEPSMQL